MSRTAAHARSLPDPRVRIILNPGSRNGEQTEAVRQALGERFAEAEVRPTGHVGHATELAREAVADGVGTVIAAGGDGTINEVVNGLGEGFGRIRFGILPLGTGNDLARTLNLPDDLEAAVATLAAGRTRSLDVGRLSTGGEERFFLNLSAGGFSGEVSERITPEVKRSWGPLAYVRAAVGTLSEICPYRSTITFDGGEALDLEAVNVVVANGRYVAAGVPVAPEADPGDGLFDVIVVASCAIGSLTKLAAKVAVGSHLDGSREEITFRRARRVEIVCDPPMPFNADGEPVGETPIRFEIVPGALEVLVGDGES